MKILDITRDKIINEVFRYGSSSDNWRIFVYDKHTAEIIGNIFSISQILNYNIIITYQIDLERKKANFPCLYFVNLNKENLNLIKNDIKNNKYSNYYVVSTSTDLLYKLDSYTNVQYKHFFINHIAIEERAFVFKTVEDLKFFNLQIKKIYFSQNNESLAEKLFKGDKQGIELVILDRSIDLFTPFLHFFTLQTALLDYKLEVKDDELFSRIKNTHIAEINRILKNESKSIVSSVQNIKDSKQLLKLVLEVPEQIKLKESLSFYIKQLETIYSNYDNQKDLIELEQKISTGYNSDGTRFNFQFQFAMNIFENDLINKEDKLRLLLITTLKFNVQETEKQFLLRKGVFSKDEIEIESKMKTSHFTPKNQKNSFIYNISRYVPVLEDILIKILENNSYLSSLGEVKDLSLRRTGFASENKKRTIFVLFNGTVTYAELAVIHNLSQKMNVDLYIGGQRLCTPKEYLEYLKGSVDEL